MPRIMPGLAEHLRRQTDEALELAESAEKIRVLTDRDARLGREMTIHRLSLIYELSFLRIFAAWETFLEESFIRYLCGYSSAAGQQILTGGLRHSKMLRDARHALLGAKAFLLWHNPSTVIDRSRRFFILGLHETIMLSNRSRLNWFSSVRHRIAHDHEDARAQFNSSCMNLCGRRFPGARPGKFLRAWATTGSTRERWLSIIGDELCNLASQITP